MPTLVSGASRGAISIVAVAIFRLASIEEYEYYRPFNENRPV